MTIHVVSHGTEKITSQGLAPGFGKASDVLFGAAMVLLHRSSVGLGTGITRLAHYLRYMLADMNEMTTTPTSGKATYSLASIIAIVSAILSFVTGALPALILAGVAIAFGALGVLIALSPSKRGGFASTFAVAVGLVSIVAAVIKALFLWLV